MTIVFFLDDLAMRSMGSSIPGLDLIWTLEQIQKYAFKELYNPEKIKGQIKENRLLYEFGEISRDEYEVRSSGLLRKLRLSQRATEIDI